MPSLKDVVGEAYSKEKILELLGVPTSMRHAYKVEPVSCSGISALISIERRAWSHEPRKESYNSFDCPLFDELKAKLGAWPECILGQVGHTWGTKNPREVVENATFIAPRPAWDEKCVGKFTLVHANQGWRDATVLAVRLTENGLERLVEYEMPAGRTFLRIERKDGYERAVSRKQLPKYYREAISDSTPSGS